MPVLCPRPTFRPHARPTARPRARAGFTLIELLITVVIIGLLAAIAAPKFNNTKGKANLATMKSDLRNVAAAQEMYFYEHQAYAGTMAQLATNLSAGVTITIAEATPAGWSGSATHPAAVPITCAVFYGNAQPLAPATENGVISCR